MSKLEKLVDDLSTLTVLEAAELSKLLEEKWGVSAATGGRSRRIANRVHRCSDRRRRQ